MRWIRQSLSAVAGLLLALAGITLILSIASCSKDEGDGKDAEEEKKPAIRDIAGHAGFIGADACAKCHQKEHDSWVGSHHEQAMKIATADTVLGDFNDATFEHFGVTSRFFKKDGKYFVNTDGPDGKPADFEIKYTFGVAPLQQYLVEFERGKIQALTICWDTRPKEEGGQRWYHLYADEAIPHTDALHWTGPNFTWNHMCAECHSTDLHKNYDEESNTYQTNWAEINVSCEACHGPGKDHAQWGEQYAAGKVKAGGDMGLQVRLKDKSRVWIMNPETGIAERKTPLADDTLLNACARCHSRRSQIADHPDAGTAFLDNYRPSHLTETLYFADGQIQDEVYVYGSFTQSKMHAKGVTCVDCHDPHTTQVPTTTNDLCAKCHMPEKYNTYDHFKHPPDSPGSQCINCHMPHRTYMGVDDRRDHSFRVPRPDLSVKLGTPNACNLCHTEQDAQWAADAAANWWGINLDRPVHYGEVFTLARENEPGADKGLLALMRDKDQPAIVRGTAVLYLGRYPTRLAAEGVLEALASEEPLIRLAAADMLSNLPAALRVKPSLQMLSDPLRSIRIEAGEALADVPTTQISEEDRAKVRAGIEAYEQAQLVSADTAAAQMNLGSIAYRMRDIDEAIRRYQRVIEIDPTFFPAYSNLATIYSERGRNDDAHALLKQGLKLLPRNPDLYYAQALVYVRQRDYAHAISSFGLAYAVAPERADIAYAYAVALHDTGNPQRAVVVLEDTLKTAPNDVQVLIALSTFNRGLGRMDQALKFARRAAELLPEDQGLAQYVKQLEAGQ